MTRAGSSFFSAEHPPGAHLVAEVNGKVAGYVRVEPVTSLQENAHVSGIAGLAGGGYEVAFQANTGNLWVTGDAGTADLGLGMA